MKWLLPAVAGIGLIAGAGGMWLAERGDGLSGIDRMRMETVVHDYVLAHPELIPQAMQRLQDRESAKVVAANRAAIVNPVGNAWIGNPDGDVTLVEYFDYNCGYCRAILPTIRKLVDQDPKLRIVFRDFPVLSDESGVAAQWSIAAARQGRFGRFHDALYAAGPVTSQSLASAARAAGLDPDALARSAEAPAVGDAISQNLAMGRQLGMSGTPAWVVGNRVLSGAMPLDALQRAIADARKNAA